MKLDLLRNLTTKTLNQYFQLDSDLASSRVDSSRVPNYMPIDANIPLIIS